MPVSFNAIPISLRTPGQYIEFDSSRAQQGLPVQPHKIMVFGQRLATGLVVAGVPTRITSAAQAEAAFGRGSMLSHMFQRLKLANAYTESWACASDDNGAGVAATGTIVASGAPTESGTLNLYIGGRQVQVAVAAGQTAAQVATAIQAAVAASTDLAVTGAVAVATVTLTARHKGECGNFIDIRPNYYFGERTPKGLVITITAMTGGTGNPDAATPIAAIGAEQYQTVIMPWTDAANLVKLETELAARFGPLVMKEGQAFAAASGTHASIDTLVAARNSPHVSIMGSGKSPNPPYEWAAVLGAVDAFEPDPARPRQTLVLTGLMPPAEQDRFTQTERNIHLTDGAATFIVDTGGRCLIERLTTTYKTNSFGVPDIAYLDIETMRTIAYLRFSVRSRIGLRFPRHKLANDGTRFGAGQAIVTPKIIRAELLALFREWELAGLAENFDQFNTDLIVERNGSDPNRIDAIIPPDVINQLRVFAGQIQFRL
ncbi:phage tail sheath subtilisin-like domain-containing protein [Polaromonas sp. JS666]|uniref:phage tail sheath subtilisin-like domain-containing protein n=1 Tax=Polaromonas sp. (strain JS666 / ATCC BAA-500) TaxID=296591 RepID=UPI0000464B62|nr:phage tail sheath subtilisin-like domain-containing protein [Polaromonas sp. JS666]ABE45640.1 bacteriophage Mu tail sheath [Polaromonas sp. JS666]